MSRRVVVLVGVAAIALAGCGDDEEDDGASGAAATTDTAATEGDALQEEIANLSDEEQIERVGEAWAEPFAKGDEAMCAYLHPNLGGAASCSNYVQGSLTGSIKLQESFAGTTVKSVDINGQTAVAEFSNDERVTFEQDPDGGAWKVVETPR